MSQSQATRRIIAEFNAISEVYDDLPIGANSSSDLFLSCLPSRRHRALDVGCGTGGTLLALGECFEEVFGIDLAIRMLTLAKRKLPNGHLGRGSVCRMNATQLGFPDETFDFVIAHTVLHHVDPIASALAEMRRVLKPHGRIVIVDILRLRLTGHWSVLTVYFAAFAYSVRKVLHRGLSEARRYWSRATDPDWIAHQRGECFIDEDSFRTLCNQDLPGATFRKFVGEMGMTSFIVVEWSKSLKPEQRSRVPAACQDHGHTDPASSLSQTSG